MTVDQLPSMKPLIGMGLMALGLGICLFMNRAYMRSPDNSSSKEEENKKEGSNKTISKEYKFSGVDTLDSMNRSFFFRS